MVWETENPKRAGCSLNRRVRSELLPTVTARQSITQHDDARTSGGTGDGDGTVCAVVRMRVSRGCHGSTGYDVCSNARRSPHATADLRRLRLGHAYPAIACTDLHTMPRIGRSRPTSNLLFLLSDLTCIRRDAEPTEPQRTQSGVNVTTEFSASAHRVCSRWRREHCELSISTHS